MTRWRPACNGAICGGIRHCTYTARVYADVDVVAKPQSQSSRGLPPRRPQYVRSCLVESLPSPWLIGFIARFLYLTDMVRLPQYRNCIMVSCRSVEWAGALTATTYATPPSPPQPSTDTPPPSSPHAHPAHHLQHFTLFARFACTQQGATRQLMRAQLDAIVTKFKCPNARKSAERDPTR